MHSRRNMFFLISLCGVGCPFLVTGCSDDSKTTGTQLQMSPEVKAEIKDMRSAQKEARAERKAAAAAGKKQKPQKKSG